jgi:drug/metabolite transporter (DMT)-like permease
MAMLSMRSISPAPTDADTSKDPEPQPREKLLVYALLFAALATWGAVFLVLRHINIVRIAHGISAWEIVWLRFVPASLCFAPLLWRRWTEVKALLHEHWFATFAVGILTTLIYNLFLITGEEHVPAAVASLVIGLGPAITFVMAVIWLHEQVTALKVIGTLLSLAGLISISLPGLQSERHPDVISYDLKHLLLIIGAPVAWSFATIIGKQLLSSYRPLTVTALSLILATLPLFPLPLVHGRLLHEMHSLPLSFWLAIAYLTLIATVFGFFVWYKALDELDATRVSSMVLLVPLFGVAFAAVWEPPGWRVLFGGIVIILGVFVTNIRGRSA